MNVRKAIRWLVLAGFCLTTVPGPQLALFGCCDWFHKKTTPCDACAPPAVPQTVNYVPQTCYRTQYCPVPVVTYRPATTYDPCTGCPTTCLRPVQGTVMQARLVPYTTCRRAANPCNTGLCGAPAAATTCLRRRSRPLQQWLLPAALGLRGRSMGVLHRRRPTPQHMRLRPRLPTAHRTTTVQPTALRRTPTRVPANVYPSPSSPSAPPIYTVPQSQMPSTMARRQRRPPACRQPQAQPAGNRRSRTGSGDAESTPADSGHPDESRPTGQPLVVAAADRSGKPHDLVPSDPCLVVQPGVMAKAQPCDAGIRHRADGRSTCCGAASGREPQAQQPIDNDGWRPRPG